MITPAVPRIKAREVAEDILRPVRRNDMKARRKKLRLSQSELATVFDVNVLSIYRHERDKVLPALWDYALKGVEAEAANPDDRQILRAFRSVWMGRMSWFKGLRHGATAWWRYGWSARCAIASALIALRKRFSAPNARLAKPSWLICQSHDLRVVRPANTFERETTRIPLGGGRKGSSCPGIPHGTQAAKPRYPGRNRNSEAGGRRRPGCETPPPAGGRAREPRATRRWSSCSGRIAPTKRAAGARAGWQATDEVINARAVTASGIKHAGRTRRPSPAGSTSSKQPELGWVLTASAACACHDRRAARRRWCLCSMRFHGRYHIAGSLLVSRRVNAVTFALRLGRSRYARWRQASEQNLESDRCGPYGLLHCVHRLTRDNGGAAPRAWNIGPARWRASKRYQAKFCLPSCFVPSTQRRRPIDTMSEHDGMKGAACLVEAQSISSSSHVGRMRVKCRIRSCINGLMYSG